MGAPLQREGEPHSQSPVCGPCLKQPATLHRLQMAAHWLPCPASLHGVCSGNGLPQVQSMLGLTLQILLLCSWLMTQSQAGEETHLARQRTRYLQSIHWSFHSVPQPPRPAMSDTCVWHAQELKQGHVFRRRRTCAGSHTGTVCRGQGQQECKVPALYI